MPKMSVYCFTNWFTTVRLHTLGIVRQPKNYQPIACKMPGCKSKGYAPT